MWFLLCLDIFQLLANLTVSGGTEHISCPQGTYHELGRQEGSREVEHQIQNSGGVGMGLMSCPEVKIAYRLHCSGSRETSTPWEAWGNSGFTFPIYQSNAPPQTGYVPSLQGLVGSLHHLSLSLTFPASTNCTVETAWATNLLGCTTLMQRSKCHGQVALRAWGNPDHPGPSSGGWPWEGSSWEGFCWWGESFVPPQTLPWIISGDPSSVG